MKVNKDLTASLLDNFIVDELKNNVGISDFFLEHDFFFGGTDFEIWTMAGQAGILLVESVDYNLTGISGNLSAQAGRNVYTRVAVTNGSYQSGNLYFNYQACADFVDAEDRYRVERNPGQLWNLSETGEFEVAATGDITFKDQNLTFPIALSESGVTELSEFTATSLVGALNELAEEVVPAGGTIGQIIVKNSSTDFDVSWVNNNMEAFPIGGLSPFLDTAIPTGWLKADGSMVNPSDYPDLFAILGTTYGGDGTTTFGLPNMSGIEVSGSGTQTGPSGQTYGDAAAVGTIREDQMQQITGRIGDPNNASTEVTGTFRDTTTNVDEGAFTVVEYNTSGQSGTNNSAYRSTYILFDSADSPNARTGTYTRGPALIVTWCIKARHIIINTIEDANIDQRVTTLESQYLTTISLVDTTTGSIGVTFPSTPYAGQIFKIKNTGTGSNRITSLPEIGFLLDGKLAEFTYDGSAWQCTGAPYQRQQIWSGNSGAGTKTLASPHVFSDWDIIYFYAPTRSSVAVDRIDFVNGINLSQSYSSSGITHRSNLSWSSDTTAVYAFDGDVGDYITAIYGEKNSI